jgi:serine/threonine protein kinase
MRRFGENLLEQGVAHRDIKPDNIGIAFFGGSGRLRLVLFDFSLTCTPPENIQAGTRPYLDPFLALRPQLCFSTQSGPHPKIGGRHWNCFQNKCLDGVPTGADRDPTP